MLRAISIICSVIFCCIAFAEPSPDFVRENAAEIVSENMDHVATALSKSRVITIGEMHGSQEAPLLVRRLYEALVQQKETVVLGIEVPTDEQKTIDAFIRTKNRDLLKRSNFFTRRSQDGRSSAAMAQLLEALPKDAIVVCFDSTSAGSAQDRDQKMAETLISAFNRHQATFLILAGNVHSSIEVGSPFDSTYKPMGYLLHTLPDSKIRLAEISALKVRYSGGKIWACMGASEADCKVHTLSPPTSVYGSAVSYRTYFLSEPLDRGYNGTLFIRELSASPPLFQ